MLPIQPRRRGERNKKLRPIRIRSRVRHAQHACAGVLQTRVDLVFEFLPVDGGAAATSAGGVAALDHEVGDDAMEGRGVVVGSTDEGGEVGAGFGGVSRVQFEGDGALCRRYVSSWW